MASLPLRKPALPPQRVRSNNTSMAFQGFDMRFFEFFEELKMNNERAWFQENKERYLEVVVTPLQGFIQAMAPALEMISNQIKADPRRNGGSMFRIYRDTRFSPDKTPYKTHAGVQFRHVAGKDAHAPGFYLHVSAEEMFLAAGVWRPASDALNAIRDFIDKNPKAWLEAREYEPFKKRFHLSGESLKRPPRGFSADHDQITDLKRKDFVGVMEMTPANLLDKDLVENVSRSFAVCSPFMSFLCGALDVPF